MVGKGLLTETQRGRIQGEPQQDASERQLRSRVRKQIYNALTLDAPVLLEDLRDKDRKKIFRSDNDLTQTLEEREDGMREAMEIETGIEYLIAFLYQGLEDQTVGSFETALQNAMNRVAMENGWSIEELQIQVEFDKNPEAGSWKEQFEAGDLSIPDATELLKKGYISEEEFAEYVNEKTN